VCGVFLVEEAQIRWWHNHRLAAPNHEHCIVWKTERSPHDWKDFAIVITFKKSAKRFQPKQNSAPSN
jgi:RNA polymerase subunit RPABC4/transcription elongation factor Spt4